MKPVLEINPSHPLVIALEAQAKASDRSLFEDAVWLLFDEAKLMDGEAPQDAVAFATRLTRILGKALGV
jgi:molecular chaperone HtpG